MASAVIRIGASRSDAPRSTSPGPNGSPSLRSRCWKWLTIRMPFRAAMPNTVRKPTSEPSDRTPSPSHTASAPPTSAIGSRQEREQRQAQAAERGLEQQEDRDRGGDAEHEQPSCAAFSSVDSPSTSAW